MLQPLIFQPIFQTTIWGGSAIAQAKGLDPQQYPELGESWEICDQKAGATPVLQGKEKGRVLHELIREHGAALMGRANLERYGEEFPLLIKFIDSSADLSIQVHPNDRMAQEREGKPYGKNEMWYVVKTAPGAKLVNGFSSDITPEEYTALLASGELGSRLNTFDTRAGDCYFIPAGRIHAIGAGNFLIEVQQASDITYRVFDYNRKDKNGNYRELHTERALEALNFKGEKDCKTEYEERENSRVPLVRTPFFTTNVFRLTEPMVVDYRTIDSFRILIAFEGEAEICAGEEPLRLRSGHSMLLPAELPEVSIRPLGGRFSCLETYII